MPCTWCCVGPGPMRQCPRRCSSPGLPGYDLASAWPKEELRTPSKPQALFASPEKSRAAMAAAEEAAAAPPDGGAEGDPAEMSLAGVMEGEEREAAAAEYSWPQLHFDRPPRRLYHFARQFRSVAPAAGSGSGENFLKGVKWSPDGSSFLTSSDDNSLRLFYLYAARLPSSEF